MTEQILTNSLFSNSKMYNRLYTGLPNGAGSVDPAAIAAKMKAIQATAQVERKLRIEIFIPVNFPVQKNGNFWNNFGLILDHIVAVILVPRWTSISGPIFFIQPGRIPGRFLILGIVDPP